ncbi:MAG: histidine kinase [Verrucomicrobia bacterium]|nr:histidine kinase [Verrucomicrobiota bacterium]
MSEGETQPAGKEGINPSGRTLLGNTAFSVSARVALQLGRESISSSVTAILELVKNAYDADADVVRIRFGNLKVGPASMVVEDDGKGMTAEDLQKNWMVIGTSNKLVARRSVGRNRVLTGEKGLGRLGLDRLCRRTRVQSLQEGGPGVELDVDWTKYEVAKSRLEEIAHPFYKIDGLGADPITGESRDFPHGTRLVLENLTDPWNEAAVAELHGELSLLISPFHGKNDFRVELETGGAYPQYDGVVQPDAVILQKAYWRIVATIDEHGVVDRRMDSRQHDRVFHPPAVPWADFAKYEGDEPKCGPLKFEFFFFNRGEWDSETQTISLTQLGEFLKSNQGVRIYRDGFRVKPYGEPSGEGDWLRLGYRRTINPEGVKQGTNWKLGYNQVVGAVFLERERNTALIDQTNREGLVVGEPFRHLYIFADKIIQFFEKNHQKFEKERAAIEKAKAPTEADQDAAAAASSAEKALRELTELAQRFEQLTTPPPAGAPPPPAPGTIGRTLEQANAALGQAVRTLEQKARTETDRREQVEREKNTLANLASLGILSACFGHETSGWSNTVQVHALWLTRNLKSQLYMVNPEVEGKVLEILGHLGTDARKLSTFASFALGNVRPDKRRQRTFCVKTLALSVFKAFEDSLQHQKQITTDLTQLPAHTCMIHAYRIDWESIFANLITNSMWALTRQQAARKIGFSIVAEPDKLTLTFEDSGPGLEAGTEEQVFEAGFSTKRNNKGEQEGTGMGLFIVKSFVVDNSGGTIRAIAKGGLGGATFIITVPRAEEPANAP